MTEKTFCECMSMASTDFKHDFLTGHHKSCPNLKKTELDGAIDLIRELTKGMEAWANQEDGVYSEAYSAYTKAKFVLGEIVGGLKRDELKRILEEEVK